MEDLLKEFGDYSLNHRHRKISTVEKYKFYIKQFFDQVSLSPEEVTTKDINNYIGKMKAAGRAINTQRLHQAAITMFFKWYCNVVKPNLPDPGAEVMVIKEERKIPNVITPDDIMRMVYSCKLDTFAGRRNAAIICLLADTGIRLSEAALLKVGNVKPLKDHMLLTVPRVKSYERIVPFCKMDDTRFVSEFWMSYWMEITLTRHYTNNHPLFVTDGITVSGTQLKRGGIYEVIKRISKRSGVKCSTHTFRHFFGTYSYLNGAELMDIKELMGHALLETTMRYIHIANVVSGKTLSKTATAGMKAGKHHSGFVKIYKDTQRRG